MGWTPKKVHVLCLRVWHVSVSWKLQATTAHRCVAVIGMLTWFSLATFWFLFSAVLCFRFINFAVCFEFLCQPSVPHAFPSEPHNVRHRNSDRSADRPSIMQWLTLLNKAICAQMRSYVFLCVTMCSCAIIGVPMHSYELLCAPMRN